MHENADADVYLSFAPTCVQDCALTCAFLHFSRIKLVPSQISDRWCVECSGRSELPTQPLAPWPFLPMASNSGGRDPQPLRVDVNRSIRSIRDGRARLPWVGPEDLDHKALWFFHERLEWCFHERTSGSVCADKKTHTKRKVRTSPGFDCIRFRRFGDAKSSSRLENDFAARLH